MACLYVVAVFQTLLLLITDQHASASQNLRIGQQEPRVETPRKESFITQQEGRFQGAPASAQTAVPVVAAEGISLTSQSLVPPTSDTLVEREDALLQNSPASNANSASTSGGPVYTRTHVSTGHAGGDTFQCEMSNGQRTRFRFHGILNFIRRGVYLDVEEEHTGLREVFFASFFVGLQSDQQERTEHAQKLKKAAIAGLRRELSLFPSSLSREALLKDYGFAVITDYCSLPGSDDSFELGEIGRPILLLNYFVAMPEAMISLCSADISKLTPETIVSMSVDMVKRVSALHKLNLLHRRIACSSFVVRIVRTTPNEYTPRVYLGDFTAAQVNTGSEQLYEGTTGVGSLDPYLARAAFSPLKYTRMVNITKQQDAWALGRVLYFMICDGRTDPYGIFASHASNLVLLKRIVQLKHQQTHVQFSECLPLTAHPVMVWLREIVVALLDPNEETRLLPEEAISRFPQLFGKS